MARVDDDAVVCDLRTVDPSTTTTARPPRCDVGACATVATAGHVDHGKSSLVLALTGTDPDRFPEEKARGLTIDLGFAFTTLPSGDEVGFVDVPGHVRFIKNMLAGVGAVDVALLVVAANEGWMPQSEEHLRILELLGVTHGMVALTKADLVDDETLELAQLELDERLSRIDAGRHAGRGVRLACRAGASTTVRTTLDDVLAAAPTAARRRPAPVVGRPRVRGEGCGDRRDRHADRRIGRGRRRARRRARHSCARPRDRDRRTPASEPLGPGTRVALNLAGVDHGDVARGDAVIVADQWATHDARRRRA